MTTYNITTYVRNRDNRVYIYVKYRGEKIYIPTGMSTTEKFQGRAFPKKEPGARAKTFRLNEIYIGIEEFIVHNDTLGANEMKRRLRLLVEGESPDAITIVSSLRRFADTKKKPSTKATYLCTARNVEAFDTKATFDTVTPEWLRRFEAHERTKTRPSQRKDGKGEARTGRMTNGVAIDLRNIRAVFNWALANEWTTAYPFRAFKIKQEQTRKRNLSVDQVRQVMAHGGRYADTFMLMLYLIGINISDLYNLPKDCIRNGRLEYRRNKTGRLFSIKVEPEAQAIIDRYKGEDTLLCFADTCKGYKDYLKHMIHELGSIVPGCTSYWSRHTWASVAAAIDVPMETISQAMGHSFGLGVTNIYVQYDTRKVDEANRKVIDWVLYGKK